MSRLSAAALVLLAACHLGCVSAGGVFELKIRGFENRLGVDSMGGCCSGSKSPRGVCVNSVCATKFRVCLMHYQRVIDENPDCTYGETTTPVLGGNSFQLEDSAVVNSSIAYTNPMVFPFNFSWPGTFSLVIEAWHEKSGDQAIGGTFEERHTLVHRMTKQGWLDVGADWTHDERRTEQHQHAILFDYRVRCDRFYYGDKCTVMCRGSTSALFGHYECLPDGTRKCLPGWKGEYCTEAACMPGCHSEHGYCERPNECQCRAGWQGKFCDVCVRYPGCLHGVCSTAWGCDCLEGWGGLFCNQDLNFCTNHRPCKNGGTCYNTGEGSYTCVCPPGFNGTDCEIEEGGCARHPCQNGGTCRDNGHNFTCVCPRGWSGHRCETAAETCRDQPCQNSGRCVSEVAGYRCECPKGFKGTNCEQRDTFCLPDTCENGGNCVNLQNGFRCACPVGFVGVRCEVNIDDCATKPCINGGTCQDEVNDFRCICPPGFGGSMCQHNINDCLTNPCANGGKCHDRINDFSCTCRPGFTGKDCSVNIDECAGQTCQNGGVCHDRVNSFECHCPEGFVGDLCQFEGAVPEWARSVANRRPAPPVESSMSSEHVVLISTLSVSVPALVLVSIAAVLCLKYRRRRAAERADDEARRQNEQNASAGKRHFQDNMIINTLDFPSGKVKNIDDPPPYSLERTKSYKNVNIDPGSRCSALNTSVSSSVYASVEKTSDSLEPASAASCARTSSALRVCAEPPPPAGRTGVYVIDDQGTQLSAEGMFATEV